MQATFSYAPKNTSGNIRTTMDRQQFVTAAFVAFGLVIAGFVIRGIGRLAVGSRLATRLAMIVVGTGFFIVVGLTLLAGAAWIGYGPLANGDND